LLVPAIKAQLADIALGTPNSTVLRSRARPAQKEGFRHFSLITTGDGRAPVSEFIQSNTLGAGGRSGLKIFMPTM
jgi:hypothetical protein